MPRKIEPVPVPGPFTVTVAVMTPDGEKTQVTHVNDASIYFVPNREDVLAYEAAKGAKRCYRTIVRKVVEQAHPKMEEKERTLVWRASLQGIPMYLRTSDEIAAEAARNKRLDYSIWFATLHGWFDVIAFLAKLGGYVTEGIKKLEPK